MRSHGCFFVRLIGAVSSSRPDHSQGVARSRGQAWPKATAERREACLTAASTAPGSNQAGHRISRGSASASSHRRSRRSPPVQAILFVGCSIPTEAARRHDRLKLAEVEFADRAQCFGGRGILQVLRQVLQPGVILGLELGEFGDGVVPAAGAAAMIGRDGGCGSPVRPQPARHDIAPGVRRPSWLFHRWLWRAWIHSEALRHGTPLTRNPAQARFLSRQLSLPVSTMSQ